YDVESNRDLRRCIGHSASLWCVAVSADGTRVLSGGKDGTVRLWEADTGRELARLEGHADLVTAVAFRPDRRRALSAGFDGELILWDLEKGKRVEDFVCRDTSKSRQALAFSPDGTRAFVGADHNALMIDESGQVLQTYEGHQKAVVALAVAADGKRLL